jgi:hypothetical protein
MRQWHAFERGENHDYDRYVYRMECCRPLHVVDAQTRLEEAGYTVLSTGKGNVYDMIKKCPILGEPEGLSRIATSSSDVDDFIYQINGSGGCDVSALGNFADTAVTANAGKLKSMPGLDTYGSKRVCNCLICGLQFVLYDKHPHC